MDLEFSFSKRMLAVLVLALLLLLAACFTLGMLVGRSAPAVTETPALPAKPALKLEVKGK